VIFWNVDAHCQKHSCNNPRPSNTVETLSAFFILQ
jgi:hypothetical protein